MKRPLYASPCCGLESEFVGRESDRWKVVLRNTKTNERKPALAKHAEMLSEREAKKLVRHAKGKMGEWEYVAEPVSERDIRECSGCGQRHKF